MLLYYYIVMVIRIKVNTSILQPSLETKQQVHTAIFHTKNCQTKNL